jgi:hypothetical protein
MNASPLDLIEELKLRRWARLNYLPPEERSQDLHPVVLNEMQLRDEEAGQGVRHDVDGAAIVPLNPDGVHPLHHPERPHFMEPHCRQSDRTAPVEMHYS